MVSLAFGFFLGYYSPMSQKITEEEIIPSEAPQTPPVAVSEPKPPKLKPTTAKEDVAMAKVAEMAESAPKELSDSQINNFISWKMRKTYEMLLAEPKESLFIPFNLGEDKRHPANQYAYFGINGWPVYVRRGMDVMVPRTIKRMYQESTQETVTEAQWSLDNIGMRIDPVTKAPMLREKLS